MTIYQFGKEGEDQRLEHRGDKVYVFDWSGDTPETTDDGPLYVDTAYPAVLHFYSGVVRVTVSVISERDACGYSVDMSMRCFKQLCQLKKGMRIERAWLYADLAREVLDAEAFALSLERS